MFDEENDETLLTFYTAPSGAIPQGWKATHEALAALRPKLQMLDWLCFRDVEDTLKILRGTQLRALIPPPPEAGTISAARLTRKQTSNMISTLPTGPWAAFFPDLIEGLTRMVVEALDDDNPTLLVIREKQYFA